MKAVVLQGIGDVEVATVDDPTPGPGEVLVKVKACGICGTDLHIQEGQEGVLPVTPGHEFSGVVVAVGSGVDNVEVGESVCADPNIPCDVCPFCQDGRVNLCDSYTALGVTRAGAAAEMVVVPARLCVVVPDGVPLEHYAFAEPLSCALHAMDLVDVVIGQSMLIYGAGTMGLSMMQLGVKGGAAPVAVVDLNPDKLNLARELGADEVALKADELSEGKWDIVVDATGVAKAIEDGLKHVRKGGTFLQFGVANLDDEVSINPHWIYDEEIRIIGSVCPADAYRRATQYISSGRFVVEPLISHRVSLEEYSDAIKLFREGKTRKVLVCP